MFKRVAFLSLSLCACTPNHHGSGQPELPEDGGVTEQDGPCQPGVIAVPARPGGACGLNGRGSLMRDCRDGVLGEPYCDDLDSCVDGESIAVSSCGPNARGQVWNDCVEGALVETRRCDDGEECVDGDRRDTGTPCGAGAVGHTEDVCREGHWHRDDTCVLPETCRDGERRPSSLHCGWNFHGLYDEVCVDGQWQDDLAHCDDPDVCEDFTWRETGDSCGLNGRGQMKEWCWLGQWDEDPTCFDSDECEDGSQQRNPAMACGLNGRGVTVESCVVGTFQFARCEDVDLCRDGASRTSDVACGLNGRGRRTEACVGGQFVLQNACVDVDRCVDGTTQTAVCGINRRGLRTDMCVDGRMQTGTCNDPDECSDGGHDVIACATDADLVQPRSCVDGHWRMGACECPAGQMRTCEGTCQVAPARLHVRGSQTGCEDGLSFSTGFRTVQQAVDRGASEIWVTEGRYAEPITLATVKVFGGFAGTEQTLSERQPDDHPTLIAGPMTVTDRNTELNGLVFPGGDFTAIRAVRTLYIYRSRFSGYRGGASEDQCAGAICSSGYVIVHDTVFENNVGRNAGAVYASLFQATDSTFVNNRSQTRGGAVTSQSNVFVARSLFRGNSAVLGGALARAESAFFGSEFDRTYLLQSQFLDNTASEAGGAVEVAHKFGELEAVACVFAGNRVTDAGGGGGALRATQGRTRLDHLTVVDNRAAHGGGIELVPANRPATQPQTAITNSLFFGNRADSAPQLEGASDVRFCLVEGGFAGGEAITSAAPDFVQDSYELATGSPGIDAGNADSELRDRFDMDGDGSRLDLFPYDLLGRNRPVDAPDLGAYERP